MGPRLPQWGGKDFESLEAALEEGLRGREEKGGKAVRVKVKVWKLNGAGYLQERASPSGQQAE